MELYLTVFVVLVMILVVIHQTILFHVERRRMVKENQDLLNRLMSRDFTAFAAGSVAMSPPVTRKTLSDYIALRKKAAEDEEKAEQAQADGLGMSVV
jgi:hypothetical protein